MMFIDRFGHCAIKIAIKNLLKMSFTRVQSATIYWKRLCYHNYKIESVFVRPLVNAKIPILVSSRWSVSTSQKLISTRMDHYRFQSSRSVLLKNFEIFRRTGSAKRWKYASSAYIALEGRLALIYFGNDPQTIQRHKIGQWKKFLLRTSRSKSAYFDQFWAHIQALVHDCLTDLFM